MLGKGYFSALKWNWFKFAISVLVSPYLFTCDYINQPFYFKMGQRIITVVLNTFDVVIKSWHFTTLYLTNKQTCLGVCHHYTAQKYWKFHHRLIKNGAGMAFYCLLNRTDCDKGYQVYKELLWGIVSENGFPESASCLTYNRHQEQMKESGIMEHYSLDLHQYYLIYISSVLLAYKIDTLSVTGCVFSCTMNESFHFFTFMSSIKPLVCYFVVLLLIKKKRKKKLHNLKICIKLCWCCMLFISEWRLIISEGNFKEDL